eukprot:scaffold22607_cov123-Cylindrotheca_fusiformis.AAC.12
MDRVEDDVTPGKEWQQELNNTCNRLSTQYLNLLRAASSVTALEKGKGDPRSGGGQMKSLQDPPPPPLAADVAISSLQCQLAVENLCVAASNLLSLIRRLRLSLLLMDEETVVAEEEWQVQQVQAISEKAMEEANLVEQEWMELRNRELDT